MPKRDASRLLIHRHTFLVRITHWLSVLCLVILLASGLQIFNAHPALYWGNQSDFENPLLSMTAERGSDEQLVGVTTISGLSFETTGVLGASSDSNGNLVERGFPSWLTLPSHQDLATGRRWHFFFAWLLVLNGIVYVLHGLAGRHLWRDLVPSIAEIRRIGAVVWDHARFRFPEGEEARAYNVLQKLTYLAIIFIALPLVILTGLTMSPAINAAAPELLTLFGGRQSARTIHFLAALALVLFVLLHVLMVVASGFWNNMRSMITGRYSVELVKEPRHEDG